MTSPAPEPAAPTTPAPPRRRRPPWLFGVGGVLVGGLIGGLLVAGLLGPGHRESAFAGERALIGHDLPGFPAGEDGGPPGAHRRPFEPGRGLPGPDEHLVVGSVVGSGANELTVVPDGAAQISIPTTDGTRVRGAGNSGLGDLDAGERVLVRVGSGGDAVAVEVVPTQVRGTVTALDGDRATVLRPDGLAVQVDLSGIQARPAVGTVVAVRGTAQEGGAVLRADELTSGP